MTAPAPDPKPVYDTYDKATIAQNRQLINYGIYSGIVHVGDKWALRYDITRDPS